MEEISDVKVTKYIPTIYTRPRTVEYIKNGTLRKRSIMAEKNGVVIIIYNKTRDVLVLVKQFRPSAYFCQVNEDDFLLDTIDTKKYPPKLGITLEFCAGLVDKDLCNEEIAIEEIFEECGYNVEIKDLEEICTICNLTDTTGAKSFFYYCEVTDDMKVSNGGGVEGENIEVIDMKVDDVIQYGTQDYVQSPACFLFGLNWFLYNKYRK
ncbi:unnamed protein product [Brassicogethes aeneus]|uniref:Uridine diphosphate glucose pyrophosphatase NUDT14 n=1 Tax=Brassicogethes aeneus TaxID=1431903 RepID=A0A9P0AUX6_BRAAE|nr:unnamed protein product [Brassicogethes aeneus]